MKFPAFLRLSGVVLATGLAATPALPQTIEFQGSAILHDFTEACRDGGWWAASQAYFMRYYPAALGDNPDSASFSLNQSLGALGFHQPEGGFDSSFSAVEGHAIFGASWTFSNARARFNRQAPSTLTADTSGPVRISGQIRNFAGVRRCDVRLEAVLVRTP